MVTDLLDKVALGGSAQPSYAQRTQFVGLSITPSDLLSQLSDRGDWSSGRQQLFNRGMT